MKQLTFFFLMGTFLCATAFGQGTSPSGGGTTPGTTPGVGNPPGWNPPLTGKYVHVRASVHADNYGEGPKNLQPTKKDRALDNTGGPFHFSDREAGVFYFENHHGAQFGDWDSRGIRAEVIEAYGTMDFTNDLENQVASMSVDQTNYGRDHGNTGDFGGAANSVVTCKGLLTKSSNIITQNITASSTGGSWKQNFEFRITHGTTVIRTGRVWIRGSGDSRQIVARISDVPELQTPADPNRPMELFLPALTGIGPGWLKFESLASLSRSGGHPWGIQMVGEATSTIGHSINILK